MNMTVIGLGYVGLANALMFAKENEVSGYDISRERIRLLKNETAPFADPQIAERLSSAAAGCGIHFTDNAQDAICGAQMVLICTPTDFASEKGSFDTSSVEESISLVRKTAPEAMIVIRSTVPVGFTERMREAFSFDRILFCPEFLREGKALYDCENPSRVIIGGAAKDDVEKLAEMYATLIRNGAPVLRMGSTEAEAVKLFSNTYLAMRVAFFNEADTFAQVRGIDPADLIRGICADPRIGGGYNNPSFGYGGYCLPKDTKQLEKEFSDVPQKLVSAVSESNKVRKTFIADCLEKLSSGNPETRGAGNSAEKGTVGIYRLTMKTGSDNFREAAVLDIIRELRERNIPVLIYEPSLPEGSSFLGGTVTGDLTEFKRCADVIAANRYEDELADVYNKVLTRDLYRRD